MHIPDGFLNLPTIIAGNVVSGSLLIYSARKVNKNLSAKRIPLIGLAASFIFTIQLISFPVIGGTSVHMSGTVLAMILLGPITGFLITASAVTLQAILFQHGGILSMGVNIFNIALVNTLIGYLIFKLFPKSKMILGAGLSSFIAIIAAASFCALELSFSKILPLSTSLTSILIPHIFMAFIEAFVTISILQTIKKIRPDLLDLEKI